MVISVPGRLLLSLGLLVGADRMTGCTAHLPPATQSRVDSGLVAVAGGNLYYESAGRGETVILIHAGNVDRRMWDDQFAALAKEFRVVRYDLRGYGRSSPDSMPFESHIDLRTLMDSLGVGRASLVGLSGGGRIAIDFALAFPKMVDRLVLAAPGLSGWEFASDDTSWFAEGRALRDRGDTIGVALSWASHSAYMRGAMASPLTATRVRLMVGDNARHFMAGVRRRGDIERTAQPPALGRTSHLRAPTLLLIGQRDTPDILRIADTLMATVPGIRRTAFADVGHFINLERPEDFTRAVMTFLRK